MTSLANFAISSRVEESTTHTKARSGLPFLPWTNLKLPVKLYGKGNWIFTQGDRITSLYIIREGVVLLSRLSADSREIILGVLGPGDYFGDHVLLNGGIASFNALAAQRTVLLVMRDAVFMSLLEDPSACRLFLTGLANRWDQASTQIEALGCTRVQDRIRALLAWLCVRIGENSREGVRINLSQAQLAQMAGTTRESVNRTIQRFKRQGILAPNDNSGRRDALLLLAPERLALPG